ncbi:MAG: hypothetical protein Kow0081_1070 [Candidatus Dojkabacteria bacterium]
MWQFLKSRKFLYSILVVVISLKLLFIAVFVFKYEIAETLNSFAADLYFKTPGSFSKGLWEFSVTNSFADDYLKKQGAIGFSLSNDPKELYHNLNMQGIKHNLTFVFTEISFPENPIPFLPEKIQLNKLPASHDLVRPGKEGKEIRELHELVKYESNIIKRKTISNEVIKIINPINEITYIGAATENEFQDFIKSFLSEIPIPTAIYKIELFENEVKFSGSVSQDIVGQAAVLVNDCNYYVWQPISVNLDNLEVTLKLAPDFPKYDCQIKQFYSEPVELLRCLECTNAVITKQTRLHENYEPPLVNTVWNNQEITFHESAVQDLISLLDDAKASGHNVNITSTYRSFLVQLETFEYWVRYNQELYGYDREKAEKVANTISAKPGFSEHQLGTAVDLNTTECLAFEGYCQQNIDLWAWLAENASKYNFYISYPEGQEHITGYRYEPWHLRWKKGGM